VRVAIANNTPFRLKFVLLAIAGLAVLAVVPRERSLRQQYALRCLGAELDGGIGLGQQDLASRIFFGDRDGDKAEGLILRRVALSSDDAVRLRMFPLLERIRIFECPDPERSVAVIRDALPNLTWLEITNSPLSDLRDVGCFHRLMILDLTDTQASDEGLNAISQLRDLFSIHLDGASIHGPGLAVVSRLPKLRNLGLRRCPIDDRGLEYLKSFTALRYVQLQGTRITRAGLKQLREALPECRIETDYDGGSGTGGQL
jgi:hypothetical protein